MVTVAFFFFDKPPDHWVCDHVFSVGNTVLALEGFEDDINIVLLGGGLIIIFFNDAVRLFEVLYYSLVTDRGAKYCSSLNERDNVACEKVVSGFWWLFVHARIMEFHFMAKLEVIVLPGFSSILLLRRSGSMDFFCNKVSETSDISSALG